MVSTAIRAQLGQWPSRPQLYAALMALLLANAVMSKILYLLANAPLSYNLRQGLGAGWVFWLSTAACLRLALTEEAAAVRTRDVVLSSAFAALALIPIPQVSAAACTALAILILLDAGQGVRMKAAAMVLAAISIQVLWSRVIMLFLAQPLADLDAHVVSLIIHRPVVGNEVQFVDRSHRMSVLGACTSVENVSTALMFFVAIVRTFRPRPQTRELYGLAGLVLTVVVLNYLRLVLMAQSDRMYHLLHGGIGWPLIEGLLTLAALAWALATVRREALG